MILAKQAVNGIFNVLAARLVVMGFAFSKRAYCLRSLGRMRLQEIVFLLLTAFVLVPTLAVIGFNGHSEEARVREDARRRLETFSRRTQNVLDLWLKEHLAMLQTVALDVHPDTRSAGIQERIENLRSVDGHFVRLGVMNRDAVAVAYSPRVDALGKPTVGQSAFGSQFVGLLRKTMKPAISDVIIAKIGAPVPILVAAVPVLEEGRFAGYVAGAVDVETLSGILGGLMGGSNLRATLLDGGGRVIASSRSDVRVMDPLPWRLRGEVKEIGGGLRQWFPDVKGGFSELDRLRNSFHFLEAPVIREASWRLVVESPLEPYQAALNSRYAMALGILLAVLLVTLAAARFVSGKVAASIRGLEETTAGLPERISRRESIAWPETRVVETGSLVDNFRSTADMLARNLEELRSVNDTLEKRIAERTASLRVTNEELRREIAERRAVEERLTGSEASYRLLAENATDVIIRIAPDGTALYISPSVEMLNGYRPEELVGRNLFELVHPDELQGTLRARDDMFTQGATVLTTHRVQGRDGEWKWIETVARPVIDPATGQVTEFVAVSRDVTDRKKAEEENSRLVAQMLHAQKLESLGLLAGGIAHDFNNLLTSIMGNAELSHFVLPPDSPAHERLRNIETAARRAAEMAGQMLAYSGQGKIVTRRVDLSATVRELASLLRSSIPKSCALELRLGEGLPPIEADATQLQQVVMNLITNAAEAIGDSNGTITLAADRIDASRDYLDSFHMAESAPAGDYVRLEVADTGCGMGEETRSRMFDPFFTTKFTGRGLGLAAVLGIVRSHRGALKVKSELGEGTSFTVLFPAAGKAGEAEQSEGVVPPERRPLSGTVLLVDDEEAIRDVATLMLRKMGLEVETARDGREAVEIFRARPGFYGVVILDLTMPRMNGEAALEKILRIRKDVPVILSSGYSLQSQQDRLAGIGASRFIQKPYSMEELESAVREALGA